MGQGEESPRGGSRQRIKSPVENVSSTMAPHEATSLKAEEEVSGWVAIMERVPSVVLTRPM